MVTTLYQYCSAVLCEKSSLRIDPCNITLKRTLIVPGERDNKNRGLGELWNAKIPPPQKTWQVCLNNCYTTARKQRKSLSRRSSNGPRNPVLWKKKSGWVCSVNCALMKPKCKWTFWLLLRIVHDFFFSGSYGHSLVPVFKVSLWMEWFSVWYETFPCWKERRTKLLTWPDFL